jgi:hypothetical protein
MNIKLCPANRTVGYGCGCYEEMPAGVKTQPLFCCICGTTEVAPFQNLCRQQSFSAACKAIACYKARRIDGLEGMPELG